jgi:hypothetical protein
MNSRKFSHSLVLKKMFWNNMQSFCCFLSRLGRSFTALIFSIFIFNGCAIPMPGVLTYEKHSLHIDCYSASDVKITYGPYRALGAFNREFKPDHRRELGRPKQLSDDTKFLTGNMEYYRSFEGPLKIQWHSLDDSVIETTIDLNKIFPAKIVPHNEDPNRIYWPIPTTVPPVIVIEVNDRTLSIYSDVAISLIPDDRNISNRKSKRNRILVFNKTY